MARHPCDPRFGLVAANGCAVILYSFSPHSQPCATADQASIFTQMQKGDVVDSAGK
jgi:hypothetical protein